MIVALIAHVLLLESVSTLKKWKKELLETINMLITFFHLSAFFPLQMEKNGV